MQKFFFTLFCVLYFAVFPVHMACASAMLGEQSFTDILALAQEFGSADLVREEGKEPRIDGKINDIFYSGLFRDCDEDKSSCNTLTLRALYNTDDLTLEQINAFNRDTKCGKLYLTEDKLLVFEYFLNLQGTIGQENLKEVFSWFATGLKDLDNTFFKGHSHSRSILEKARELLH